MGQKVVGLNPDPNTGRPGDIDNNFVNVPITRNRTDQFDVRVDQSLSPKLNLFEQYSFSDTNLFKPAPKPGLAEASTNDTFGFALWRSQAVAAGTRLDTFSRPCSRICGSAGAVAITIRSRRIPGQVVRWN